MIELHVTNRNSASQPLDTASRRHTAPRMWTRDIYTRSLTRSARESSDALFSPLSRRPIGKTLNVLLGCKIAHSSLVDLLLHVAFVGTCSVMLGSVLGLAFGFHQAIIDTIGVAFQFAWHATEPDGIFRVWNSKVSK